MHNEQIIAIGPPNMKVLSHYSVDLHVAFDEPGPLSKKSVPWSLLQFLHKAEKVATNLEARCAELRGIK